jgi:acetone carboxylase gamma subunit
MVFSATHAGYAAPGQSLKDMLETAQRLSQETGHYWGVEELELKRNNPLSYDSFHARLLSSVITARETSKRISASPGVREVGESVVALYTPDGDSVVLSTGIVIHVHTWKEPILLPIGEHLYIVQKGNERIVKCDCGHEFGSYTENWKLNAHIFVQETEVLLQELYPGAKAPDPTLQELREFICPDCGTLLEVEALPPGDV